jgi:hypothetical protein
MNCASRTIGAARRCGAVARRLLSTLAAFSLTFGGCAAGHAPGGTPKPMELRIHLAADTPQPGYSGAKDESGRPLYVAAEPFLTDRDVKLASVGQNQRRALVLVEFMPPGEMVLADVTTAHTGARLAIYLDGALVMSPPIRGPLRQGKVYLDGGFSVGRAQEVVTRLNAYRPGADRRPGETRPAEPPRPGDARPLSKP